MAGHRDLSDYEEVGIYFVSWGKAGIGEQVLSPLLLIFCLNTVSCSDRQIPDVLLKEIFGPDT